MNKKIFGIVFILSALMLVFWQYSSGEKKWTEAIELPKAILIEDTITYELTKALLFFDKKDVISLLKSYVDEVDELVEKGEITQIGGGIPFSNDIYLLNHLDSISGNFTLQTEGAFQTKIDTLSLGELKSAKGIQDIKDDDWKKDTTQIIRDYSDQRNFFFDSFQKIVPILIEKNKVYVFNRKSEKFVDSIVLQHHSWGISSYSAFYKFENGDFIIGKELILGL